LPITTFVARPSRRPFVLILVVAGGLLVGGVVLAELLNLAACPLCVLQRMLYLALALVAAVGIALAGHPRGRRLVAVVLALGAGLGLWVAGYQVWLQRFAPQVSCTGHEPWWETLVNWAGERVPLLFQASGLCSEPAWSFLGLAIADWSLLAFAGLLGTALYAGFARPAR
jgi:disulfide bond formation protein DsbB